MSELKFEVIVSSNLESAAVDEESGAIIVRFKNGSAYRYPNAADLWDDFKVNFDGKQGRSAGKFLNVQLRPKPYTRIDDWK